jgi:hypothetical protein
VQVTLQQLALAFEAWEHGFRAEPTKFLTLDECAALSVDQVSADRAAYMLELLTQQTNEQVTVK